MNYTMMGLKFAGGSNESIIVTQRKLFFRVGTTETRTE